MSATTPLPKQVALPSATSAWLQQAWPLQQLRQLELMFSAQGEPLVVRRYLEDGRPLPELVRSRFTEAFGRSSLLDYQPITLDGNVYYRLRFGQEDQPICAAMISAEGEISEARCSLAAAQLPSKLRQNFSRDFAAAKLLEVEVMLGAVRHYRLIARHRGQTHVFEYDEQGSLQAHWLRLPAWLQIEMVEP